MFNSETKSILRKSLRIRILLVLVSIVLLVLMFPKGESLESEVSVGTIWIQNDLIASLTFEVLKDPEAYRKERETAAEEVNPIFVLERETRAKQLDSLRDYNNKLLNVIDNLLISTEQPLVNPTFLSDQSFQRLTNLRRQENLMSANARVNLRDSNKNIQAWTYRSEL